MAVSRKPISLWRNRDYLLLWSGQLISTTGSGISQIAFPLLVLAVTGSPAQAGLVGAFRSLSYVLFTLPAGVLLDRWNRKLAMIMCDTGFPLIVIVIAQQHHASAATIGLIFGIGGLGSTLGALFVGRVQQRFSFAQIIIAALWLYTALWLPLATLPSPLMLGLITVPLFFIGPFYSGTNISRRLAMTPDRLQSRVNSVSRLISLGCSPLSLALTGLLLQYSGPQATILLSVAGQFLLALLATINPHIRRAGSLQNETQQ